jgi:hypothetical protein
VPTECLGGARTRRDRRPGVPITLDEMVHGAAANEALIRSAASNRVEKVR